MWSNSRADFRAEVALAGEQELLLQNAWFFANNGFGGNAVPRDALSGKDAYGAKKHINVNALAGAEIVAGRGPRSVTVIYPDGEREVLYDVTLSFVNGQDKHGSKVEMGISDQTGLITLRFLSEFGSGPTH